MYKYLIFLTTVLFLFNCDKNPTDFDVKLITKTDKNNYLLNEFIKVSIHNGTPETAFFGHCGERIVFLIETKKNNDWIEDGRWGIPCLAIFPMGIKKIAPFVSYSDTIIFNEAGIYRLKFPFGWQEENTWEDWLFCNEFTVQ